MARSIINGNGVSWQLPSRGISVLGGMKKYATYEELLRDNDKAKFAWVTDATGDPTVAIGGAMYSCNGDVVQRMFSEYTTAAPVEESTIKQALTSKANEFEKIFVRSQADITLANETKYYIMNTLIGTLPSDQKTGATIQIVVLPGGESSILHVPEGMTVNGQPGDVALNFSVYEVTFVFDKENNDWISF